MNSFHFHLSARFNRVDGWLPGWDGSPSERARVYLMHLYARLHDGEVAALTSLPAKRSAEEPSRRATPSVVLRVHVGRQRLQDVRDAQQGGLVECRVAEGRTAARMSKSFAQRRCREETARFCRFYVLGRLLLRCCCQGSPKKNLVLNCCRSHSSLTTRTRLRCNRLASDDENFASARTRALSHCGCKRRFFRDREI